MTYTFFATCPKYLETLLADEIESLGGGNVKLAQGGVEFSGSLGTGYCACLWSRLANRVLLLVRETSVLSTEELYQAVLAVDWQTHFDSEQTFVVDYAGSLRGIKNSHFGALKIKDAIVDYFRNNDMERPSISKAVPDLRVNVYCYKGRARISIDLSGDSLHRRGYRQDGGIAPLKENLASALLIRANWPEFAKQNKPLIDPMCGSGTLLIEAALIATDTAPGLLRWRFGLQTWKQHDAQLWQQLWDAAELRREQGELAYQGEIHGYDGTPKAVTQCRENSVQAGVDNFIRVSCRQLQELKPLTHKANIPPGLVITNPPYGERLSEVGDIKYLYQFLGEKVNQHFIGWQLAMITGNVELGKAVGLRSYKQYSFYNGPIKSQLLLFDVTASNHFKSFQDQPSENTEPQQTTALTTAKNGAGKPVRAELFDELSSGAQMFANRVKKNTNALKSWKQTNAISCYRLYDADMPEYAVAVDVYGEWLHVQEYAAPAKVDTDAAKKRLHEVLSALPAATNIPSHKIILKQRKPQSGKEQYQPLDQSGNFIEVTEGGCRLLVNLTDYLDTGLFLDHRPVRMKIQQLAKGKRLLNLFSYTASASIHAIQGGAKRSVSVDMSPTYQAWARKNYALNGFNEQLHQLVQADCFEFMRNHDSEYDLIFLDPPTFSNSKRMSGILDVQRDHVWLIKQAMSLLADDGLLLFSTNFQKFQLDEKVELMNDIQEITEKTLDIDFKRNKKIHRCWEIRHKNL